MTPTTPSKTQQKAPAYKKVPRKVLAGVALAALLGGGAAQLAVDETAKYEGYIPSGYTCPAGVLTKCFGDTTDVILGAEYTFEECEDSLNRHLLETAEQVARLETCFPACNSSCLSWGTSFAFASVRSFPGLDVDPLAGGG